MAYRDAIEIVRGTSEESQTVAWHYSNALCVMRGTSILVSDRYEYVAYKNFLKLKIVWLQETQYFSSSAKIYNNAAYLQILSMGLQSVPWMLRDLQKHDTHWFYALNKLTGMNPIQPAHYGIVPKMKEDWIAWAKENNYDVD